MYNIKNRHDGLTYGHQRQEPHEFKRFVMHTHITAELFYFVDGRAIYHIEGNSYPLQPGDILLMRPSEAHYIEQDPTVPYERICLHFDTTLFSGLDPENTLLRPYFDREPGIRNLYRTGGEETCRTLLDNIVKAEDRLSAIANLILLLQQIGVLFQNGNEADPQPDTPEYKIIQYINRNLSKGLSIQELCNHFFISRAQLCRMFKKITGTSVGKYVRVKRMIAAQDLLLQGKKPTEVYAACGYQDYSTFYRAYMQYFGYSPKDIRQINENQQEQMDMV